MARQNIIRVRDLWYQYRHDIVALKGLSLDIKDGDSPIVPVMLGDAKLAVDMAADMLKEGIYVIGFSYPVVPQGEARIRVQVSAAHETAHLDRAVKAFETVGKRLDLI